MSKLHKNHDLLGWIPCVIGRLDFSKVSTEQIKCVELDSYQAPEICFSYTDEHSLPTINSPKIINVVSSVYNWKDSEDTDEEFDGLFRFITIFESMEDGNVEGSAFLILHKDIESNPSFSKEIIKPLQEINKKVETYKNALIENPYTTNSVINIDDVLSPVNKIKALIKSYGTDKKTLNERVIEVNFNIQANGLTFLNTLPRNGVQEDITEKTTRYFVAKQAFIYLKTILHRHKHHLKSEDRLTSVHKIDSDIPKNTAIRLVDDLRRSVIELKERELEDKKSPDHNVQGVISYAKSLIEALNEIGFLTEPEMIKKKSHFDNMLSSWLSMVSKVASKDAQKKESQDRLINYQLISLFVTITSLFFLGIKYTTKDVTIEINSLIFPSLLKYFQEPSLLISYLMATYFLTLIYVIYKSCTHRFGLLNKLFIQPSIKLMTRIKNNTKKTKLYLLRTLLGFIILSFSLIIRLSYISNV